LTISQEVAIPLISTPLQGRTTQHQSLSQAT
jgi:hypothetical protein